MLYYEQNKPNLNRFTATIRAGRRRASRNCEQPEGDVAEPAESLTFVNSVYTEALALAQQAQDHLAGQARHERADMTLVERALITSEAMRLTARLSEVIAWLLTHPQGWPSARWCRPVATRG